MEIQMPTTKNPLQAQGGSNNPTEPPTDPSSESLTDAMLAVHEVNESDVKLRMVSAYDECLEG